MVIKKATFWLGVLGAIVAVSPLGFAEQLGFKRQFRGHDQHFSYAWKDAYGTQKQLQFTLPAQGVDTGRQEVRPFSNKDLNAYVIKRLQDYAQGLRQKGVDIQISPSFSGYSVRHRGVNSSTLAQINQQLDRLSQQAEQDFLSENFYQKLDSKSVMIDHKAVVKRYVAALRPVAQAIAEQTPQAQGRDRLNYTLNFLQTIPYDQLRSRYTAGGAGFQTPYGLLYDNRGDCDTKAVALAALIRNLYPRNRVAIIYTPGHAFVGVSGRQSAQDYAVTLGGSTFVLMDPTGPAQTLVGQISASARHSLENNTFSYQEVSRN